MNKMLSYLLPEGETNIQAFLRDKIKEQLLRLVKTYFLSSELNYIKSTSTSTTHNKVNGLVGGYHIKPQIKVADYACFIKQ